MLQNKNILLYVNPETQDGARLQNVIKAVMRQDEIIITQNLEDIAGALRQPQNEISAAIILTATHKELVSLLPMRELLHRIPVILILPDQEQDTVTKAHILRPRLLSYTDSDFSDVRDVFRNIVGKTGPFWN